MTPKKLAELKQAITQWEELTEYIADAKARERELRAFIIAQTCPPKTTLAEGTERLQHPRLLREFKVVHKVNRKIEEATLRKLTPDFIRYGIPVDALVKTTPELVLKAYRDLNAAKQKFFDRCLSIKPGTAELEIEPFTPEPK